MADAARALAAAHAELEIAQRELRALRAAKEEKARARRLRAAFANMSDESLVRIAGVAAETLGDERLRNSVLAFARLAFTPAEASDSPEKLIARSQAIASLRSRIVGALLMSAPTVAQLAVLWGARLRKA